MDKLLALRGDRAQIKDRYGRKYWHTVKVINVLNRRKNIVVITNNEGVSIKSESYVDLSNIINLQNKLKVNSQKKKYRTFRLPNLLECNAHDTEAICLATGLTEQELNQLTDYQLCKMGYRRLCYYRNKLLYIETSEYSS